MLFTLIFQDGWEKARMPVIAHWRLFEGTFKGILGDVETQLAGIQLLPSEGNLSSIQRSCQRARKSIKGASDAMLSDYKDMGDEIHRAQANVGITKCLLEK